MLLKVHSFRKTEIKPILFFEPIVQEDLIRAELVVVRKLVILSCTVTLWPGLVKCRHQHVYRLSHTRAKTVTNTWPDPCSVTNNDQPSASVYFAWKGEGKLFIHAGWQRDILHEDSRLFSPADVLCCQFSVCYDHLPNCQ